MFRFSAFRTWGASMHNFVVPYNEHSLVAEFRRYGLSQSRLILWARKIFFGSFRNGKILGSSHECMHGLGRSSTVISHIGT